jgi:hypothetical protein
MALPPEAGQRCRIGGEAGRLHCLRPGPAINPFTRAILKRINDRHIASFVQRWDAFEALAIRIYKSESASPADEAEHRRLRAWLIQNYVRWQPAFAAYWPEARVAGQPAGEDPFAGLLAIREAAGFVGNRPALRTLPAARETLNRYLADQVDRS